VHLSADLIERELDASVASEGVPPPPAPPPDDRSARRAPGEVAAAEPTDPQLILEREVLRTALQHPNFLPPSWKLVVASDFRAPMSQALFAAMDDKPLDDLNAILEGLPDDAMRSRVRALAMSPSRVEPDTAHIAELIARLRAAAVERESVALRHEMARLGEQLTPEERRRSIGAFDELERRRRSLLEDSDA
jgi:DNA primase